MDKAEEKLQRGLELLGFSPTEEMILKFKGYMRSILRWNESVNLTAIKDEEEFIEKHFLDSLSSYGILQLEDAERIIDVGTGGGFPGVPLAIVYPQKKFVLVDSLQKRLKIIDEICKELKIDNVTVVHGRAEELGQDNAYRQKFDVVVSRAVANLSTLSEYCLPLVKIGGAFLAYKGEKAEEEIRAAEKAIEILGGKAGERKNTLSGNGIENHTILIISKEKETPQKYPRKSGKPSKNPLN